MPNKKEKATEVMGELKPYKLSGLGLGYKEESFLIVLDYIYKDEEEEKTDKFSVTFAPENMKVIIGALFECGRAYQKQFGKDIGFGDIKED